MGVQSSSPEESFCVAVGESASEGESPIYVNSRKLKEPLVLNNFPCLPEANDLTELIESCANKYEKCRCMGERKVNPDGSFGQFVWLNYRQVYNKILSFASALQYNGIKKGDLVGIFSHNCIFWHLAEFAIHLCGAVVVPISDRLGPDTDKDIIRDSEITAIIVHSSQMETLNKIGVNLNFTVVISFETEKLPDNCFSMEEFVTIGQKHLSSFKKPLISPEDHSYIIYSSNEKGPKGCILTHRSVLAAVASISYIGTSITTTDVFISYIPLAHIYAISVEILHIAQGASIGFYSGNLHNLNNDIKCLRPTVLCGVPRVFNRLLDAFNERTENLSSFPRHVLNFALSLTTDLLKENNTSFIVDRFVLNSVRHSLGDRIRLIVIGGAPIRPDVYDFIRKAITPNIVIGYGLIECSAAGSIQEAGTGNATSVGAVSIGCEMKLRCVEGLNYNPIGATPTGEILIKGNTLFEGYHKHGQFTDEWIPTGDIGMITNGKLQIIDQVKSLIKMSQGEYMYASQLAKKYCCAKGVESIIIVADPHHSRPVAIVVPTPEFIDEWKRSGVIDVTHCEPAAAQIVESLNRYADKERLRSFERVAGVILETDRTIINQFGDSSNVLRSKFANRILDLYSRCDLGA